MAATGAVGSLGMWLPMLVMIGADAWFPVGCEPAGDVSVVGREAHWVVWAFDY
jgi:hypothetical protein